MFRWCCYCQSFMGESAPKNDYSLTHGVCISCKSKLKKNDFSEVDSILPIKIFFEELQERIRKNEVIDKDEVISRAKSLSIDPSDLFAGILQPLLYEIGKLYEEGKVTVIQEHRFSFFVKELFYSLRNEYKQHFRPIGKDLYVDVLISCANGNYHEFGASLIEMHLRKNGIVVESLVPGLPPQTLIDYAKDKQIKVIGLSVSLPEQLDEAEKVANLVNKSKNYNPLVVVGGFGVTSSARKIDGAIVFSGSMTELVNLIQSHLASLEKKKTGT